MDDQRLWDATKKQLTLPRWEHTLRVIDTASEIARHRDLPPEKVRLAALLHDYCKCWSPEELLVGIRKYHLSGDLVQFDRELWHAPVGAEIVQEEFGVQDLEIVNAIRFHTTGRPNMSLLEKIIFVADYIEPGRDFSGVEQVRKAVNEDLDQAVYLRVKQTIEYLKQKKKMIHPFTQQLHEQMSKREKGRN